MEYGPPNPPTLVVFDDSQELLIALIKGRILQYKGIKYCYSTEAPYEFLCLRTSLGDLPIADWGRIGHIDLMCRVLIGKKLKEVFMPFAIQEDK